MNPRVAVSGLRPIVINFRSYIDIEPVLNFRHIKLQRVFLSYKVVSLSSHYLIFYHHIYARQLSRSFYLSCRSLFGRQGNLLLCDPYS